MNVKLLPLAAALLLSCTLMASVQGADDRDTICGDLASYDDVDDVDKEFTFLPQFKVHVEAVMPDMGRIANSWMQFSTKLKTLKYTLKSTGWDHALYQDYEHHQTLEYNFLEGGRGVCRVYPDMGERLGFFLRPEPPAAGKAPTVSEVFRLAGSSGFGDNIALKKTNRKNLKFRSLKAAEYVSCQKIQTADAVAIVKVTYLVTNDKLARTEKGTVPLQINFKGKYVSGRQTGEVDHTYNFFHYTTVVGDDDFQTPTGIVCPKRKGPNTFPQPPLYITFGQEIHDSQGAQVVTLRTVYDKEFNFVAEEIFDPRPGRQDNFRFDDFYAGLSYQIDTNVNYCGVTNISDVLNVNDYTPVQGGKVKMMTPEQFWDREGIEYHYNGMKHFRGLETEAWIGEDKTTGRMYEWYFTFGIEHTMNDQAKSEQKEPHRVPYKRIFWPDNTAHYYSTYFFQVDLTEPDLILDLSSCYPNRQQFVSLYVHGLTLERVQKDETLVIRRAVRTLSNELGVPFTRIASPQIAFKGDKGYIVFNLLDTPEHASDLVTQHNNQPSLAQALATLKKKTKDRKLVFEVGNKLTNVKGEAEFEELAFGQPKGADSGYSAGAMAGLSIAMVVVGLAAGGGGGYWFFIRR